MNVPTETTIRQIGDARKLHQQGRLGEAGMLCREILRSHPRHPDALHLLGVMEAQQGRPEEALPLIDAAIAGNPGNLLAHCHRGTVLRVLNRNAEAMECYDRVLAVQPAYVPALMGRALLLHVSGLFEQAVNCYEAVLKQDARNVQARLALGDVQALLGRTADALESYEAILKADPGHTETLIHSGNVLLDAGRHEAAVERYARALATSPDYPFLFGNWLHAKMRICDWAGLGDAFSRLSAGVAAGRPMASPFTTLPTPLPLSLQLRCAEMVNEAKNLLPDGSVVFRAPAPRPAGYRLKIGYFSADFRDHPVGNLAAELFESHDRSRFELIAFSFGPPSKGDAVRCRLEAAFDRFIDVRHLPDREVAAHARKLGVDIAVDLTGFTAGARTGIFSSRAAPIQVCFMGFPGTMGSQYIDYLIADRIVIGPDHERYYAEKIVYLPGCCQPNTANEKVSDAPVRRTDAGLPDRGFVFCCFNRNWKITPTVFHLWMRILRQAEGSVLWLFADSPTAARNLQSEAVKYGVDPSRLVFARHLPRPEHLARHKLADLFLDTFPCNAHATASDALLAGLPVLTLIGETFAGRVAASILHTLGLPDLVTHSVEEYEALALRLATDAQSLVSIRERLSATRHASPLTDTAAYARNLEAAYVEMSRLRESGQSPKPIVVAGEGGAGSA